MEIDEQTNTTESPPTQAKKQPIQRKKLTRDDRHNANSIPLEERLIPSTEIEGTTLHYYLQELRKPLTATIATHVSNFITNIKNDHALCKELQIQTLKKLISEHSSKIEETPEVPEETWRYQVHMSANQGRRASMEDRLTFLPYVNHLFNFPNDPHYPPDIIFAGIYDGHGGAKAAEFCASQLHFNVLRNPNFPTDPAKAFHEGFLKTDQLFCEQARNEKDKSGATATAVAILGDSIIVANVGDSSAVLCKRKDGVSLASKVTIDHKASNEDEKKRVKETGGLVVWFGGWRVNGTLAVSRSIGDEPMSQQLIPDPYIFQHKLTEEDDFLIIATDGLWDVFSPESAAEFVNNWRKDRLQELGQEESSVDITTVEWDDNCSSALVEEAMKLNSKDNVTAMTIFLKARGKTPRSDTSEIILSRPIED